jgi:hypothetical protein
MVMVAAPAPPTPTFTFVADEESLKLGAAGIVRAMAACAVSAPDVPVTVSVDAPAATVVAAVSFNALPVNVAVTPVGKPEIASVGVPANPFTGVTAIVLVPDAPGAKVMLAGDAATLKLGPAFIVKTKVEETVVVP